MEKEKKWFIESIKQRREDAKFTKELLKLLDAWRYFDFDKYDKLPIKTAEELINNWYWEKVIKYIDKFADNYSEVMDKLIDAKYDVLGLLFHKNNLKYNLTDKRILKLIWYKPGIICLFDKRRSLPSEKREALRWMKRVLTDYECYNKAIAKISDISSIHSKYVQMSVWEIYTQYFWILHDKNGSCLEEKVQDTYWYHRLYRWIHDSIRDRIWL